MKNYKQDQYFLIDIDIIDRIIEYSELNKSDTVLEIGAGYGNLTKKLAEKSGKVFAVEIDSELAYSIPNYDNVTVINKDALKIEFPFFNKVVSNLPYSISSPITFKLLKHGFELGILMYQYEFARRMVAVSGEKEYGRLSITIQYYADVEILEIIDENVFSKTPNVKSAIVKIIPRSSWYKVYDETFFMKFIKAVFSQKRKKLKNAILNNSYMLGIDDKNLEKIPYDLNKRPETFSPHELAEISNEIIFKRFKC